MALTILRTLLGRLAATLVDPARASPPLPSSAVSIAPSRRDYVQIYATTYLRTRIDLISGESRIRRYLARLAAASLFMFTWPGRKMPAGKSDGSLDETLP